ncbi:MAG: hypothetical protein AAGA48_35480 [Myxococcota bacterium]
MSTLIMFLTWLLSLVGFQTCENNGTIALGDQCPDVASTVTVTPATSSMHQDKTVGFISNGL